MMLPVLFVEMLVTFTFYQRYNQTGHPSTLLLAMVSLVSSIRASASLFLTLTVSMGWGTVRGDLQGHETIIYLLTMAHLILSIFNIFATMTVTNRSSIIFLIVSLPLAACNIIFFIWSMSAIKSTKADLLERKQSTKLAMYERLTKAMDIIFMAAGLLLLLSIISLLSSSTGNSREWMARHWQSFWFLADGWSTLVVLGGTLTIAWLWRPRVHNRTFGMDEVADGDDFDLRNFVELKPKNEWQPQPLNK